MLFYFFFCIGLKSECPECKRKGRITFLQEGLIMQKSISDPLNQRKSKKLHEYILLGGQMGKIPIQWLLFLRIFAIFLVSYHLVILISLGYFYPG